MSAEDLACEGQALAQRIRTLSERHANETALTFTTPERESSLPWREYELQAESAAQALFAAGVRPGSRVLIELPNSPTMLVASLAAWKLSAQVFPLNCK